MMQELNPRPVYTYIRIQLRIAIHSSAHVATHYITKFDAQLESEKYYCLWHISATRNLIIIIMVIAS